MDAKDLMNEGDVEPPTFLCMLNTYKKKVGQKRLEKILLNFGPEKSMEDKMSYLWNNEEVHCYVTPAKGDGGKQLLKAVEVRGQATTFLRKSMYDKTLELYNLGLSLSPHPKVVLPFERVCDAHGEVISEGEGNSENENEPDSPTDDQDEDASHERSMEQGSDSLHSKAHDSVEGSCSEEPEEGTTRDTVIVEPRYAKDSKDKLEGNEPMEGDQEDLKKREEESKESLSVRPKRRTIEEAIYKGKSVTQKQCAEVIEAVKVIVRDYRTPKPPKDDLNPLVDVAEMHGMKTEESEGDSSKKQRELETANNGAEGSVSRDSSGEDPSRSADKDGESYKKMESSSEGIKKEEASREPDDREENSQQSDDGDGANEKSTSNSGAASDGLLYTTLAGLFEDRAYLLYDLKEYERCLRDIEYAITHGIRGQDASRLVNLKEQCQDEVSKGTKRKCKEKGVIFSYGSSSPPILDKRNPTIPALSSAVNRKYFQPEGRFLISTRDIKPGEVLGVEEPYCSIVNRGELMKFCSNCLKRCVDAIPCPNCCVAMFCSEECTMKDYTHPHWPLCNHVLPSLIALKMDSIAILTAHVLTQFSFLRLREMSADLKEEEANLNGTLIGNDEDGVYRSSSYRSVYHLETNEKNRTGEEIFDVSIQAFVLTKLLKGSKRYFVDEEGKPFSPSSEDLVLTLATVLRHLMNLRSSAVSLSELRVLTSDHEKSWSSCIGCGVYPSIALANHSCNPNTSLYNHGKTLVLVSTRSIPKNTPITLSYINQFRLAPGDLRDRVLKENYFFSCNCAACSNDWFPDIDEIFELKCVKCSKAIDLKKFMCNGCQTPYKEGKDVKGTVPYNFFFVRDKLYQANSTCKKTKLKILSQGECSPKDRAAIVTAIELMEKYVKEPCSMLLDAQETLRLSYEREGSWVLVKELAKSWIMGPPFLINSAWTRRWDVFVEEDPESPQKSPQKSPSKRKGRAKAVAEGIGTPLPMPPPFIPIAVAMTGRIDASYHDLD